jgi:ubiquinol-cytochrome c reductase iron-sulfur subunit
MRALARWLLALLALLLGRRRRRGAEREGRIVPPGAPALRAEAAVVALLLVAAVLAVGFIVVYALDDLEHRTQLLGLALGLSLGCVAAALIVAGKRLVVSEEIEEGYPEPEHPEEQEQLERIVDESGSRITRKRLLAAAGGTAGAAIGLAAITPALSLGPVINTDSPYETPWRRGRRLVDREGRPWRADEIATQAFYTAYPEGASRDEIGSPVVIVRLDPGALELPPERARWAPGGILAFSKVCTHAGCAIALYRKPLFPPVQPRPALVCPCHYSTFDPATGGEVIFGPAGRPLPQLPLAIDAAGELRAGGNYSGPVGPSWAGVRGEGPRS